MVYIIVPVYNTAVYLPECLESIFSSSYQDIEVICVNDGSTDNSLSILEQYEVLHPNMRIVSTENQGLAAAKNNGLDALPHLDPEDYITFVDSDDRIGSGYIEALVQAAILNSSDIVCSSFSFFNSQAAWPFRSMDSIFGILSPLDATQLLLADQTVQSHSWSKLYRAHLWNGVRFPNTRFIEDQATTFRLFCKASKLCFLRNYDYFYRQKKSSLCSSNYSPQKAIDAVNGYLNPCQYSFPEFSEGERHILIFSADQALAACYLSVYRHFDKKQANELQKEQWSHIKRFIQEHRIIRGYKPSERKEKMKRACYLYARPFYRTLFKIAS